MWTIFKAFIEFVTILLLFFGPKAGGILAPPPGIELGPPTLGGEVNHWASREVPRIVAGRMWRMFVRHEERKRSTAHSLSNLCLKYPK